MLDDRARCADLAELHLIDLGRQPLLPRAVLFRAEGKVFIGGTDVSELPPFDRAFSALLRSRLQAEPVVLAPAPAAYKELPPSKPAQPADTLPRQRPDPRRARSSPMWSSFAKAGPGRSCW